MRPFICRLFMLALCLLPFVACSKENTSPAGQPLAADFTLRALDGQLHKLSDYRGKVVFLNFWATWCVPCRAELPLLDGYYRHTRQHGLSVFAVATDGSAPLHQLKPLFAAMAIPAVRRIKGMDAEMPAVPTNYIIDRAGSSAMRNPARSTWPT